MTIKFTNKQIIDAFVDLDLPEEGYNNQDFYLHSAQTIRYILVTEELSPETARDGQLELGQEDNRFYNCIEFDWTDPTYSKGCQHKINNPELLKELMDMDYDQLYDYCIDNEYDWIGDDFYHINQYLDFASEMQDEFQFVQGDICNDDEYMEIIKQPWIRDKERGYKSDNKYEIAYKILSEYVNPTINKHIKERLEAVGVSQ